MELFLVLHLIEKSYIYLCGSSVTLGFLRRLLLTYAR